MKRFLSILLSGCLLLMVFPFAVSAASLPFRDVASTAWYRSAVEYVYEHGVMNGKSSAAFEPESNLLRAEMCQLLYNLEGKPPVRGSYFWDVSRSDWYFKPVNWAFEEGIVSGKDHGNFDPESPVTREQMVRILFNYAEYKGFDTSGRASLSRFADAWRISTYAYSSVQWAVSQGILSGTSHTALSPGGTAVRAQVASVLMKFLQNGSEERPEEPEPPAQVDSAEYEIQRKDHSYFNDTGKMVIEHYYDLLVLQGDSEQIQAINSTVQSDYQKFLYQNKDVMDAVFREVSNSPYLFYNTMDGEVTYNEQGIICLLQSWDWFMNGVHNVNFYGLTFDLHTGERMVLSDLFPEMDKASLSDLVKEEVKQYIAENPNRGWDSDAKARVDEMEIDSMDFCVNQGKVIVLFETYELAPGMSGPVQVELSLSLSESSSAPKQ